MTIVSHCQGSTNKTNDATEKKDYDVLNQNDGLKGSWMIRYKKAAKRFRFQNIKHLITDWVLGHGIRYTTGFENLRTVRFCRKKKKTCIFHIILIKQIHD